MEEGKIEFRANGFGGYDVWSDSWSGNMEFCGEVRRMGQPMLKSVPWMATNKSRTHHRVFRTRKKAAEHLLHT